MAQVTLTEFLLARIAEDEAVAREAKERLGGWGWSYHDPCLFDKGMDQTFAEVTSDKSGLAFVAYMLHHQPRRVLAECEAKRAIIAECGAISSQQDERAIDLRDDVMRALAAPYVDHPDYPPGWKP